MKPALRASSRKRSARNTSELEASGVGPDILDMLARQYDEPVFESSMVPTFLVSRLVRQHCTVGARR